MKKTKSIPTYPGPPHDEVQRMTDEQVDSALVRLKEEPKTLDGVADDEILVAAHGDKDFDHIWTKAELKALRQKVHAWYRECLKAQLLSASIAAWIASLSDVTCWTIIEQFEQAKVALSEKRYTSKSQLRERARRAVYASECSQGRPE